MSNQKMNRRRFTISDRLAWGDTHHTFVATLGAADGPQHIGVALSATGHWQCYVNHTSGHVENPPPSDECRLMSEMYAMYRLLDRLAADGVTTVTILASEHATPWLQEWRAGGRALPAWRGRCTTSLGGQSIPFRACQRVSSFGKKLIPIPSNKSHPCAQAAAHMLATIISCDSPLPEDYSTDDTYAYAAIGRRVKRSLMTLMDNYGYLSIYATH